ncbi:hypothetical protein NDU88_002586 [Pleurodeles waltl]|uniref:Uncharacterized protein n=1 Tax=Pleurodeles waltl TaxID=8319 RepID=A0AAV7UXN0_PLEWA|nr:hypothetical protein NDU88_002586 [Pleurodeles waltl]
MFGFPRETQERIKSACIEERAGVRSEKRKTAEQEAWCMSPVESKGVKRRNEDEEEEASWKMNEDVEEEARSAEQRTNYGEQPRGSGDVEGSAASPEGRG